MLLLQNQNKMNKFIIVLFFVLIYSTLNSQDISLYNSEGKAVAYVEDDDDLTIYLWEGKPVCYISGDNLYGFNGIHLGWWVNGVIRDHNGNAVGATKSALGRYTQYEPYKGYKQYRPYKKYKQYAPYKPYWSSSWSDISFRMFLLNGVDD